METAEHIQKLKDQVASIDKQLEELRGAWGDTSHRKALALQELAGKKEKEIKRYEYLANMSYTQMNDTRYLLNDMVELMEREYSHVKDEVKDIYQIVLDRLEEFEGEQARRFT